VTRSTWNARADHPRSLRCFFVLYLLLGQREILAGAACALVPLGIGAGLLIDARINARGVEAGPTAGG